jgi:Uma2 family endonuclease
MASIAPEQKPLAKTTPQPPYFTLAEVAKVAELLPDRRLELIKGEIKVFPPPEPEHQYLVNRFLMLSATHVQQIATLGCLIGGSNTYFEVPESF